MKFKQSRIGLVASTIAVALLAVFALMGGFSLAGMDVSAAPPDAPPESTYYCGSNPMCRVTLQNGDGLTVSAASENLVRQSGNHIYNRAELYCTMDENAVQTQTVKLQASADNSNWVDVASGACAQQTADGTVHVVITDLPGTYWRAYITLGGSNQTTPTIKLVLKRTY